MKRFRTQIPGKPARRRARILEIPADRYPLEQLVATWGPCTKEPEYEFDWPPYTKVNRTTDENQKPNN